MKKQENFPTAVPTNRHGSYLVICSDACMAILESEYLAGIHLTKTDIPVSDFCQVCSVCGQLSIKVAQCVMHETCPTVQWKQTIEGINTAREVAKYFSFDFVDSALDVIYDFIRNRKPGTDPIDFLKRMTR